VLPKLLRKIHDNDGALVEELFVDDPAGGNSISDLAAAGHEVTLRVRVFNSNGEFNTGLPWREGVGGKALMHMQYRALKELPPDGVAGWEWPVSYEVQLLLVAEPPAKKPAPVYRDWCRRFFPGGLPSLNKRRR
jgi:hypothetical protein